MLEQVSILPVKLVEEKHRTGWHCIWCFLYSHHSGVRCKVRVGLVSHSTISVTVGKEQEDVSL